MRDLILHQTPINTTAQLRKYELTYVLSVAAVVTLNENECRGAIAIVMCFRQHMKVRIITTSYCIEHL